MKSKDYIVCINKIWIKIKDLVDYLEKRLFKTEPNDIRKSWEYMKYMNEACEILNGGKVDEQPIL